MKFKIFFDEYSIAVGVSCNEILPIAVDEYQGGYHVAQTYDLPNTVRVEGLAADEIDDISRLFRSLRCKLSSQHRLEPDEAESFAGWFLKVYRVLAALHFPELEIASTPALSEFRAGVPAVEIAKALIKAEGDRKSAIEEFTNRMDALLVWTLSEEMNLDEVLPIVRRLCDLWEVVKRDRGRNE